MSSEWLLHRTMRDGALIEVLSRNIPGVTEKNHDFFSVRMVRIPAETRTAEPPEQVRIVTAT